MSRATTSTVVSNDKKKLLLELEIQLQSTVT